MPAIQRPLLNMMEFAYRIRNFSEHFETNESRKRTGPMEWVKMRTKHDGRSYRRITRLRHAVHAVAGWYLILQVAAKMPARGLLADLSGPLDAEDLADKTGIDKKAFQTALTSLTDEKIGWIERVEWDRNLDFDANLARLGIERSGTAGTGRHRHGPADAGRDNPATKRKPSSGGPAATGTDRQTPADNGSKQQLVAGTGVQEKREENITGDGPLPSPAGGQSNGHRVSNPDIAKRLICEKILGGKDPARAWSYQAQERLATLCKGGGIPLVEIEEIAVWRSIPKSDDIPELKKRIDPITETSLMEYWGDEFQRAHAYLEKYRPARNGSSQKKEPADWREFFRWKYGAECELPASFWKLEADQQNEWEREHEEFERKNPTLPMA